MRKTLLALALLSSSAMALQPNTYIFGDSLSSPKMCGWQNELPGVVFNFAQAGLTLKAFDFPNHLLILPGGKAIVYIGSNDAGSGTHSAVFKHRLEEIVYRLKHRGAEVFLIAQPYLDVHYKELERYRKVTARVAEKMKVTYIDPHWGSEITVDGIHPSCAYHKDLGIFISNEVGY